MKSNVDIWPIFEPIIIESCTALFGSYGVNIQFIQECPAVDLAGQNIAAFIGYTGTHIRGTLLLGTSFGVVQMSHPIDPRLVSDLAQDLRDWAGELANQLLGRIKNRLLPYGVALQFSTPMCLVARELRASSSQPEGVRVYLFSCAGQDLFVRFDATLAEDFALAVPEVMGAPSTAEGEMLLF